MNSTLIKSAINLYAVFAMPMQSKFNVGNSYGDLSSNSATYLQAMARQLGRLSSLTLVMATYLGEEKIEFNPDKIRNKIVCSICHAIEVEWLSTLEIVLGI